jgi:hypothetical protein
LHFLQRSSGYSNVTRCNRNNPESRLSEQV